MSDTETFRDDMALPFQLEASSLRGRLVRLGSALNVILGQREYPERVGTLLGEATVIAAALGTSFKLDGIFTLQIKSDGAVKMLVADVTSDGAVRATAQLDTDKVSDEGAALLGEGFVMFTADQEKRYQGVVKLEGDNLAEAVQHYFRQSEQLPTGIIAAARRDASGAWRGGCLLLQRMPSDGGININTDTSTEDDWHRAMMLMRTCSPEELTDAELAPETLLYRLFHEEGVRTYEPKPLRHQCRCSAERVESVLRSLPQEELAEMAIDGVVAITCEFCNRSYGVNVP